MEALSDEAVRVLGCLAEKERTVPDTYPMTLNGLVSACNQTSNRWPVVRYDPPSVQRTLDHLKGAGWVRFVHPSHSERTTKFRHVVPEKLGVEPDELAVLTVLFLRGPQTGGELRQRSERLHAFASVAEVEAVLHRLAAREEPLVRLLDRRPGEREARWAQLLAGEPTDEAFISVMPAPAPGEAPAAEGLADRVAALEAHVAHLYSLLGVSPP